MPGFVYVWPLEALDLNGVLVRVVVELRLLLLLSPKPDTLRIKTLSIPGMA